MAASMEAGYAGKISYSTLGSFSPSMRKSATLERRRNIAKVVAAFALTAAAVCVVFASGASLSHGSASLSAPPTRRNTMLSQMPEMKLASKAAGFDVTALLETRTTQLETAISNNGLCRKRDTIVQLFNDLLKRLIDEQDSQKAVAATLNGKSVDAHTAMVDAEAAYELAKKTHRDATRMKNLALTEASTAITAHTQAIATYNTNKAPFDEELDSIESDISMIKELLAMIKVLHNEPAATAAKATQQARLLAKVVKIQKLALRIKSPTAQQLAAKLSTQSLAEYDESNAVVKILMDLLQDILNRKAFIEGELKEFTDEIAAKLVIKEAKESDVVDAKSTETAALAEENTYTNELLSKLKADAASAKIAEGLQKTLNTKAGVQFDRERFVIGQITIKINAYCNEVEDTSVDVAHMSCPFPDSMRRYADVCTCMGGYTGPDMTGPCEKCADDEYCFSTGRGKCVEGAELVGDHSKCVCSVGYHGQDNGGPCEKCEEGHMCAGGEMEPDMCPTGKIANDDHTACVIKPGFYAAPDNTAELAALECTTGKVCIGGLGGEAADCLDNSHPNADQTACTCDAGFTGADNSACAACPADSKCAGGTAAPESCPANHESSTDGSDCECKQGFYGPNAGTCVACPAGSYCIGGNNKGSCPAYSTASNGGKVCSCNRGYYGDGRTCTRAQYGTFCAGNGSPHQYCVGTGRTTAPDAGSCECAGIWKGSAGTHACTRKTYDELQSTGQNIPACVFDSNQRWIETDNHEFGGSGDQQKFNMGKWTIRGGACINYGWGTTGKGAEACIISNCNLKNDVLTKVHFHLGATFLPYEHEWWNGANAGWKGAPGAWYGPNDGWNDKTSSFIVN